MQVIHQPVSRPKYIRASEYAGGRKIGLEGVKVQGKSSETGKS
jgi:hypothetical protein